MKFAVLSHVLPPSWSGQSMVLYKLLKDLDPESYCLISREDYAKDNSPSKLKAMYYPLKTWPRTNWPSLFVFISSIIHTIHHALQVTGILKREKCDILIVCSGDLSDLPAGCLSAYLARIPYIVYLFDDYTYQWTGPRRAFARSLEPTILKRSAGVIVPNEYLGEEIFRRHGVRSTVIHNPCVVTRSGDSQRVPWPANSSEIEIVYTGSVYHAHYDAFKDLVAAINEIGSPIIKLHIYTAQKPEELKKEGIYGPVVFHGHLDNAEVLDIQRRADILFLPLAFDSAIPEVIKTSSPGKMGEYLSCGRPILVHAPADSYVSWYFKTNDCGVVVDYKDTMVLKKSLNDLITNSTLRDRISSNALIMADRDFELGRVKKDFINLITEKAGII